MSPRQELQRQELQFVAEHSCGWRQVKICWACLSIVITVIVVVWPLVNAPVTGSSAATLDTPKLTRSHPTNSSFKRATDDAFDD